MTPQVFFGPFDVGSVVDNGDGTVLVKYNNGTEEQVMKKTFELCQSSERKDWGYVQKKKLDAMRDDFLKVIFAYDVEVFEIDVILKMVSSEVKNRINRAINFLWKKNDALYNAALDPSDSFSVNEAEKIIQAIPKVEVKTDAPEPTTVQA